MVWKMCNLNPSLSLSLNIYIYIYNEKPLHNLDMYGLKKVQTNTMYNLNHFLKKKV